MNEHKHAHIQNAFRAKCNFNILISLYTFQRSKLYKEYVKSLISLFVFCHFVNPKSLIQMMLVWLGGRKFWIGFKLQIGLLRRLTTSCSFFLQLGTLLFPHGWSSPASLARSATTPPPLHHGRPPPPLHTTVGDHPLSSTMCYHPSQNHLSRRGEWPPVLEEAGGGVHRDVA